MTISNKNNTTVSNKNKVSIEELKGKLDQARLKFVAELSGDYEMSYLEELTLVELRDLREEQLEDALIVEVVALPSGGISRRTRKTGSKIAA